MFYGCRRHIKPFNSRQTINRMTGCVWLLRRRRRKGVTRLDAYKSYCCTRLRFNFAPKGKAVKSYSKTPELWTSYSLYQLKSKKSNRDHVARRTKVTHSNRSIRFVAHTTSHLCTNKPAKLTIRLFITGVKNGVQSKLVNFRGSRPKID